MTLGTWFWAVWMLSLLFGVWGWWHVPVEDRWPAAPPLLVWVLLGLLGWATFGPPIKGG